MQVVTTPASCVRTILVPTGMSVIINHISEREEELGEHYGIMKRKNILIFPHETSIFWLILSKKSV